MLTGRRALLRTGDACDATLLSGMLRLLDSQHDYEHLLPATRRAIEQRRRVLVTDPPYCVLTRRRRLGDQRDRKVGRKIDDDAVRKFDSVREYRTFTEAWLPAALRNCADAGAGSGPVDSGTASAIVWTNFLGKQPIVEVAQACGQRLVGEFLWAKLTSDGDANERLARVYEVALVFQPNSVPPRLLAVGDAAVPMSVVAGYDDDGEAQRWGSHPNHKPYSVLETLLRTWTRPDDVIVDCFAGSGSIPAAALRLVRCAVCIELNPKWADIVQQRLARPAV